MDTQGNGLGSPNGCGTLAPGARMSPRALTAPWLTGALRVAESLAGSTAMDPLRSLSALASHSCLRQ